METFYEVIVKAGRRWCSFSLIYVLNLSLFQTLSVCNEGGGGEVGAKDEIQTTDGRQRRKTMERMSERQRRRRMGNGGR